MMAGRRADELAAVLGKQFGNGLCILPSQGFPRQDDHPRIDLVRVQPGLGVGVVDDVGERRLVNTFLVMVRSERDGRLEQGLAGYHAVAAGEIFAQSPQVDAREYDLRARGADVHADAGKRDVVLEP